MGKPMQVEAQSAELLRVQQALDRMTDSIFALDRSWRFTYANATAAAMFHLPADDLIGHSLLDDFPGLADTECFRRLQQALDEQQPEEFTTFCEHAARWLRMRIYPSPDGVTVYIADMTREKAAQREAEEKQRLLDAVLENAPAGITLYGTDGTVWAASRYGLEAVGLTRDEVAHANFQEREDLRQVRRDDGTLVPLDELAIMRCIRENRIIANQELWLQRKDGSQFPLAESAAPIHDEHGDVIGGISVWKDLTELYQQKAALRESEEKFRALVEQMQVMVGMIQENRFIFSNPCIERHLGYTRGELQQIPFDTLIHPDDRAEVVKRARRRLQGEPELSKYLCRALTKSGEVRWVDLSLSLIDYRGKPTILGTGIDVTVRKQAEDMLREQERQIATLFATSPDGIMQTDLHGTIVACNRRSLDMLGYAHADQLIGTSAFELIAPEDRELAAVNMERTLEEGTIYNLEYTLLTRDGAHFPGELSVSVIRDSVGQPCAFVAITRDITERKQAEEALAREQAFFSTAIDILPVPIWFKNEQGVTFLQNRAARAFRAQLGYFDGQKPELLYADTRAVVPYEQRPARRALRGEVLSGAEFIYATQDGREVPVIVNAAPVLLHGETAATVVATSDITALKAADRAKNEFLAILSHELQTPLTSIMGWAEMALHKPTPEMLARAMGVVHRNARRQQHLLSETLDTSRLLHRKIVLTRTPADLWQQASIAVENVMHEARELGLTLIVPPAVDTLPILADTVRIQQCIGNLLQNSLKFTPAGGAVTVSCRREGEWALLEVQDTGRGIPREALPTLFDVFQQVNRNARSGGLGLGLALVRGIVELHGGRVFADSPGEGHGSTFTIALPLAEPAD